MSNNAWADTQLSNVDFALSIKGIDDSNHYCSEALIGYVYGGTLKVQTTRSTAETFHKMIIDYVK